LLRSNTARHLPLLSASTVTWASAVKKMSARKEVCGEDAELHGVLWHDVAVAHGGGGHHGPVDHVQIVRAQVRPSSRLQTTRQYPVRWASARDTTYNVQPVTCIIAHSASATSR
jgi:hypothetical protein